MKLYRRVFLGIALFSTLALGADVDRFQGLEQQFICMCGCNMGTLNMCTMTGCHYGGPMRAELKQMIGEGKTDESIRHAFVAIFGIQVLSAPPMSGFSLAAWLMPFAALSAGLLAVAWVVRKWRANTPDAARAMPMDEKDQSRVEEELKKHLVAD